MKLIYFFYTALFTLYGKLEIKFEIILVVFTNVKAVLRYTWPYGNNVGGGGC